MGSIPGQGTKIPHAVGQLSPHATIIELARLNQRACVPQTTQPTHSGARAPQLERKNTRATTREKPESHNEETVRRNERPRNERPRMPQRRSRLPQLRSDTAKKKRKIK